MDVTDTLVTILLTYLLVVIVRWAYQRIQNQKVLKRCGIPGPKPSFFMGHLAHVRASKLMQTVAENWMKDYGNVLGLYVGDHPYIIINDIDILKQIMMKDFHVFRNRPSQFTDMWPMNKSVVSIRDTRWKEVRTILTPTFSSSKIKLMTSILDKKIDVTLDIVNKHATSGNSFDMYELVQGLTLDVIADCAFGMKTNCQADLEDMFRIAVRDFFRFGSNPIKDIAVILPFISKIMLWVSSVFTTLGKMNEIIVAQVERVIVERRKTTDIQCVDLLQLLIEHAAGSGNPNGLTDEEIIANAYVFLLAGFETTATALAFTFYLLITHPEIQEKLFEEIDAAPDCNYNTVQELEYLDQVFSESLRIYPPVTGFVSRNCEEDYKIGNFTIPKGADVQAPVWTIHHDPKHWPDPWTFNPDRFSPENRKNIDPMTYMPFGLGRRNCVGARFAQLEAKLALFRLIKKFRFELCDKTDHPITLTCTTVITNPAHGIILKAVRREESFEII